MAFVLANAEPTQFLLAAAIENSSKRRKVEVPLSVQRYANIESLSESSPLLPPKKGLVSLSVYFVSSFATTRTTLESDQRKREKKE